MRYTTEELKGYKKQPEDSCPHFNNAIQEIQKSINEGKSDFIDDISNHINNAVLVVNKIEDWSNDWERSFSLINNNDDIVVAYVLAAKEEKEKYENIDLEDLKENFESVLNNDFLDELDSIGFDDPDFELDPEQDEIDRLFLNMKRDQLFGFIENMRTYASSKRAYTNHMKEAYKNHSIINDLNDIIQPYELIEDQKKSNNVYNLGVIFSESSNSKLKDDGIISDIDLFLLDKMNEKEKKEIIMEGIKKSGYASVSFYKTLDDFRDKKGYKTEKIDNKPKNKIKYK